MATPAMNLGRLLDEVTPHRAPEALYEPSCVHGTQISTCAGLEGNTDKYENRGHDQAEPTANLVGQPHGAQTAEESSDLNDGDDVGGKIGEDNLGFVIEMVGSACRVSQTFRRRARQ